MLSQSMAAWVHSVVNTDLEWTIRGIVREIETQQRTKYENQCFTVCELDIDMSMEYWLDLANTVKKYMKTMFLIKGDEEDIKELIAMLE